MTEESFKPFLSWTYDREIVIERVGIINELVSFITRGAYNNWNRQPHEKTGTFTNAVAAAMQPAFIPLIKKVPRSWKAVGLAAAGDTAELLIAAFKEGQRYSHYDEFLSCPPFSNEELVKKFCTALNTNVCQHWNEASPTVLGAYRKAIENMTVSETRLASAYAIRRLLRRDDYDQGVTIEGFDEICHANRLQREHFKINAATFGGLLGDQVAKDVARMLARDCCHKEDDNDIDYSVMHFLYADGRAPGSWSSTDADKLRADIMKCYNELGKK